MPKISVSAREGAPEETSADTRVVGLFEGESPPGGVAAELAESGEAKPALRKLAVGHEDGKRVIVVGLGKREELDAEKARMAAAVAAQRARDLGAKSLSWAEPGGEGVAGALVEGTLLGLYRYDAYKSGTADGGAADGGEAGLESLEVAAERDVSGSVERARVVSEATNRARDLQNTPSNVATPEFLAARAREIADGFDTLTVEVLGRDEIVARGMGAFAAVAQGSDAEPRLITFTYENGEGGAHLGFVGKGVTFDTGGISIKPAGKMHEMKYDMSGGAGVIEAMGAIAELGIPGRITAVVPATENMPSGHSMKPGDIVSAMNGTTIEINNTDAEGRLILADALCYAVERGAERIIDIATLTGGIVIALGSTYTGLFANDDEWFTDVDAACAATGEIGWRLPLHPEYLELAKGQFADLTNAAEVRKASSIYAAEFLRQFVDGRPWVHADIAGTAYGGTRPYNSGPTGWGVRTLVELAQRTADKGRQ